MTIRDCESPYSVRQAEYLKQDPYWWEGLGDSDPELQSGPPRSVDIAVVGSGVTGLHAALFAAREGRRVAVFDAGRLGFGASTRNNGMVVPDLRKSPSQLRQAFGEARARRISRSAIEAFEFILAFIRDEGIDCGLERNERDLLAETPHQDHHLRTLAEEYTAAEIPTGFSSLTPRQLEELTGLGGFAGALLTRGLYALDPGRYVEGLIRLARAAGASLLPHCRVTALKPTGAGFAVRTSRGETTARSVAVATNGYSSGLLPWLQRRVIPVTAFMATSAPLDAATAARLFPAPRSYTTSERNLTWIRSSPDRTRILFGGRTGYREDPLQRKAERLRADPPDCCRTCCGLRSATAGKATWPLPSMDCRIWERWRECTTGPAIAASG